MNDGHHVQITKRATKRGTVYHLRWTCPTEQRRKSRKIGTDLRHAERERWKLETELVEGTYTSTRRIKWDAFVAEHVAIIPGKLHAREAERTLDEFGTVCAPGNLDRVTFAMVERFVGYLRTDTADHKANRLATINKKLRYLAGAFTKAIDRDYLARSPMKGWRWQREDKKKIRVASEAEEAVLIEQACELYGDRLRGLIVMALNTGGRRGELLTLVWDRIDLPDGRVTFVKTKGKRDRVVFINPDVVAMLRRLQARTIREGGPFIGMSGDLSRQWRRVRDKAGITDLSIHDLRRTYVTRLIRTGVPLPTVQRLAGHSNIKTTIEYYNRIDEDDLRAATVPVKATAAS